MPGIGKCDLIVTSNNKPLTHYSPHSDFLFRGNAFNFVVQVCDQESYDWVDARGQAIKDNLLTQEQVFTQRATRVATVGAAGVAYSMAQLNACGVAAVPTYLECALKERDLDDLLKSDLLAAPSTRVVARLSRQTPTGLSEPVDIDLNYQA